MLYNLSRNGRSASSRPPLSLNPPVTLNNAAFFSNNKFKLAITNSISRICVLATLSSSSPAEQKNHACDSYDGIDQSKIRDDERFVGFRGASARLCVGKSLDWSVDVIGIGSCYGLSLVDLVIRSRVLFGISFILLGV
ncbi:uncharacterized protein LAJ45_10672 [Morchella importuna]|uniref:uncharacterized protein n=1 Tax=Morchella importuna TaxID=1174673 RepID=UPI001E8CF0BD|nr:uncharacterized protein LAJ45_10672 [Morchella importuna]KAH8145389.1 hypothetical protein LAJ45_10672 [Morchella importuna]